MAASWRHDGTLYAHNDSGDTARFFAMDETTAAVTAELDLPGAGASDWEDIEVGPCPGGSCVYAGDIGDNAGVRDEDVVYRVVEPEVMPTGGAAMSVAFERFPFTYPDRKHNAEALLVHPITGQLFVIIKELGNAAVYEMPQPFVAGQRVTLVKVATVPLPADAGVVTGADFHPSGDRMLVRTTGGLYESARAPGASLQALFTATPAAVPVAVEPQGEAVAYARDGKRYFTSSEAGSPPPPLSVVSCRP